MISKGTDQNDSLKKLARNSVPYSACSSFAALSGNSDLEDTSRRAAAYQVVEEDSDDHEDMYEEEDDDASSDNNEGSYTSENDEESDADSETDSDESEEDDVTEHRQPIEHLLKVTNFFTKWSTLLAFDYGFRSIKRQGTLLLPLLVYI